MKEDTIVVLMPLSGSILWEMYGESFGYLQKPLSLHVPVDEVTVRREWISEIERGVLYLQRESMR
ncbi:hypothetical protein JQN58_14625 [Aneurinibacillus sp. BA2021]|nr:hypothetical protein [Aneurinibacillus sp. BA2021]